MSSSADLPHGWAVARLGNLGDWGSGGTPSKSNKAYYESGTIPWLVIGDLNESVVYRSDSCITEEGLKKSSAKLLPVGTLLVAMYGSIGKTAITGIQCATNQAIAYCRPYEGVSVNYLHRMMQWLKPDLIAQGKGGTQQNISQGFLKNLSVPLAPSNEQRRIADKLDRVLARVDAANEHLSRVGPLLKRFRQEVLREAVSGRILGGNGYKGRRVALSEVCDMRLGKMLDQAKNKGNFVPYIGNINVRWFGFDLSSLKRIRIESHEVGDLEISDGDLMVCEGGEPGRCAVWNGGATDIVFQKALHRVRPHEGVLDSWWLAYNLKIQCDSGEISGLLTGSTIKYLTGRSLGRFSFYLPDYEEQRRIVAIVKSLFAFADILEGRTLTTKQNVQRLFPSVLSKAFRGDLIPQILGDEPASEFLARVAETKASENHEPIRRKRQASA